MPPLKRGNQQLEVEQRKAQLKIAIQRIHVERALERIRRFGVMRFVRHDMYKV